MLDAKFYDTLSRLQLGISHKSSLNMSGSRKSVHKGISAEFSDFREYMPGDDLRRLDWNVYARLDKLYIREYMEEKEAVVSVLIDTSASMDYGAKSKAELAGNLASVVGFLALNNMDRLVLYDMKDMGRGLSVSGGRNGFSKVLRWLEGISFSGEVDMLAAAKKMQCRGPGAAVIISDFLHPDMFTGDGGKSGGKHSAGKVSDGEAPAGEGADGKRSGRKRFTGKHSDGRLSAESGQSSEISGAGRQARGYEKLLQYLDYRRQRPVILHTMAEEELRIALEGTLNLIDAETGEKLRLTVDAKAIGNYERELGRFTDRMKKGCAAGRGAYVLCDAGKDLRELVFQDLRVIYDI